MSNEGEESPSGPSPGATRIVERQHTLLCVGVKCRMTTKDYRRALIYLVSGINLLRLIYINFVPLVPEEAYYWKYAKHLALSYFDHPPMTAYVIAFFTWVGGDTVFFVRLGAVILSSSLTILLYAVAAQLFKNQKWAFLTALTANCTVAFSLGATIITPDTPLLFFWATSVYGLVRLCESNDRKWWYLVGTGVGLAMLSKYTAVLILPGILVYALLSREQRKWMLTVHPYLGLAVAFLIFGPVIVWNYHNDWASFMFQLPSRFAHATRLRVDFLLQLLGTQLAILTPVIFILVIAGWLQAGRLGLRRGEPRYSLLFWIACPVYIVFTLSSLTRLVKMNWLAPAYLTSIIAAIAWSNSAETRLAKVLRRWFKPGLVVGLAIVLLTHILPFVPAFSRPGYNTWSGWKEMAARVMQVKKEMGTEPFIFGDDYQVPSEITFYTANHETTYSAEILGREGLQYDYWTDTERLLGKDAIFVRSNAHGRGSMERIRKHFDLVEEDTPLDIVRHNRVLRVFYIYRCYGYRGPNPQPD
jgi:hypothetical protein